MPRLSLGAVIPPLMIAVLLALSIHKMTAGPPEAPPPPSTAALREAAGSGGAPPSQPPAANTQTHS
ncbi:hypothetical protein JMJ55_04010 [Belnapia sp. T6]|uniref:Uncharacterized protein n=1 Tax=Belnapia mucosa TaxID=2804532 RepID=A0ABS1V060_9PROT|nr:hypothetical protein [Belnapia mucosa]MBL6454476.1 hypothetical protein [Belnapia mucosa]